MNLKATLNNKYYKDRQIEVCIRGNIFYSMAKTQRSALGEK